jgi:calcium/calmodulin-dependent protein kinase (CaM kinase) II/calcium/calmodulin-dependent protein kinase I
MKQIRYGEYEFHERYWGHVSQDAKNMIAGMLTVNPEKRISAADALKNSWITADKHSLENTDLHENQQQLKDFKPKAKMRQVVNFVSISFQK